MDRRNFIGLTAAAAAGLALPSGLVKAGAKPVKRKAGDYSLIVLGDTHYDTEPDTVYHSDYNEKTEWLNRVQRAEFKRNGEMWRDRCRRLVERARYLMDDSTRMVLQVGDLIQGDCGNPDVHVKMLSDTMDYLKTRFNGLPVVTVVGNHDIRGTGANAAYHKYMPQRMSEELGRPVSSANFSFNIGDDAYVVIDFNKPDDDAVQKLIDGTAGARHFFVLVHGPVFPFDSGSCRWFYHGADSEAHTKARRHFREEFARRNAIVLTGHTHRTEFADWYGDGGRITQMTFNSVWASDALGKYETDAVGASQYGELRKKIAALDNGTAPKDETALFDEYRPGLKAYSHSPAAGSYLLNVSGKKVTVDFYAGDSIECSERFILR